ncbi:MAG: purine-nucleoside phosphorylase [Bacilli bacterium]|nr:purine-nucleoside phosphorylase [Bacilli bacterium]
MGTPHINANKGDFAKVVLMPGDPIRAKWIADTYLHDYKEVTNLRGILGFTGYTKNGKRISVMASGMGIPSIGIYSYELFTSYGVEAIIRVGTCGSYQPNINLKDVLICNAASTDSNWISQYKLSGTYSATADLELAAIALSEAKKANIPFHVGNILAADVFYDPDPDTWKAWASLGVMGVEMESYSLYVNAARFSKKALCLLTVTDSFINRDQMLTAEERAFGLGRMIELAIATAEHFCN